MTPMVLTRFADFITAIFCSLHRLRSCVTTASWVCNRFEPTRTRFPKSSRTASTPRLPARLWALAQIGQLAGDGIVNSVESEQVVAGLGSLIRSGRRSRAAGASGPQDNTDRGLRPLPVARDR